MDPKPTEDVFYKFEIPYPKRESLPDADIKKSLAMNIVDDQNQQATNPQVSNLAVVGCSHANSVCSGD